MIMIRKLHNFFVVWLLFIAQQFTIVPMVAATTSEQKQQHQQQHHQQQSRFNNVKRKIRKILPLDHHHHHHNDNDPHNQFDKDEIEQQQQQQLTTPKRRQLVDKHITEAAMEDDGHTPQQQQQQQQQQQPYHTPALSTTEAATEGREAIDFATVTSNNYNNKAMKGHGILLSSERGRGFLGDGLNAVISNRAGHASGDNDHYTSSDGGGGGGGNSAMNAYSSGDHNKGGSYRSGNSRKVPSPPTHPYTTTATNSFTSPDDKGTNVHTPSLSPIYYIGDSNDNGKGKGKGSSKSKSTSKSKSKSKSKKGKGYKYRSEYEEAAKPIEGNYGADQLHPTSEDSGYGMEDIDDKPEKEIEEESIELTPFALLFDIDDSLGTPSSDNYGMAIDVTMGYLNTYMSLQYEGDGLEEFETTATSTIYRDGVPQIDFVAMATFQGIDLDAPSLKQLDEKVAQAFSGANLALYLSMLQNLPASNAFSTTTGVRLTNPTGSAGRSRMSFIGSVSTVGKAGILGAIGAGSLIIFAIGFMVYGSRRGKPYTLSNSATTTSGEETTRTKKTKKDRKRKPPAGTEQDPILGETTTCASSTDDGSGSGTSYTDGSASTLDERISFSSSITHRKARNDTNEKEERREKQPVRMDPAGFSTVEL